MAASTKTINEKLELYGSMKGHTDWVTGIIPCENYPDRLLSCSRDKSLVIWKLALNTRDEGSGFPIKRLKGHSHFLSDVTLSSDSNFAITSSWDKTLRLWDLNSGQSTRTFTGHTKDVLSVSFSADNRQICSGGRDKSVKLFNTLGHCKYTLGEGEGKTAHTDWVSTVKISPCYQTPVIVTASWDRSLKLWDMSSLQEKAVLNGNNSPILTLAVSPDCSLCATGSKDHAVMLWDLTEHKMLYILRMQDEVHGIAFSPNRYWLAVGAGELVAIYDLETKQLIDEVRPEFIASSDRPFNPAKGLLPKVMSLCWSVDGQVLYAGYTDGIIRLWRVVLSAHSKFGRDRVMNDDY